MQRFGSITQSYYRGADCIILVYDISDPVGFEKVPEWCDDIEKSIDDLKSVVGEQLCCVKSKG